MFCPKCGTQLNGNEAFCGSCGFSFSQSTPTPQLLSQQAAPPTAPIPQQPAPIPQPAAQKAQAKGANPIAVFLITFIILGAIVAAVILFIEPGVLRDNGDDDGESSSVLANDSDESSEEEKEKTVTKKADDNSSQEESTTASQTTTTAQAETPEPATTTTTEPKETEITTSAASTGKNTEPPQSTRERPAFDEFEWCFGPEGVIYDIPGGMEEIDDISTCTGGWKALVIYNPTNKAGTYIRELDNFTILIADGKAEVIVDWYLMDIDTGESYSEEDLEDTTFTGQVQDGEIYALAGDAAMTINRFWTDGEKQYATGMIDLGDGTYAYAGLVRP